MQHKNGFTLVEMIASLVIIAIMAAFGSLFLVKAMQGYLHSQKNAEYALKTQIALQRINRELQDINSTSPISYNATAPSVTYTCIHYNGTRTMLFDQNNLLIRVQGAAQSPFILLDNIADNPAPVIQPHSADLDNDGSNDDVAFIQVDFTLQDLDMEYSARVYPGHMNRLLQLSP